MALVTSLQCPLLGLGWIIQQVRLGGGQIRAPELQVVRTKDQASLWSEKQDVVNLLLRKPGGKVERGRGQRSLRGVTGLVTFLLPHTPVLPRLVL